MFLSSHVLSEVQHVADRVGLIREGSLVLVASVDDLRAHAVTRRGDLRLAAPGRRVRRGPRSPRGRAPGNAASASRFKGSDPLVKALARYHVAGARQP